MAATDQFYRNQLRLDLVFGVSCVLMLLTSIWMLYDDYNRAYKPVQRKFRDVETALSSQEAINRIPEVDEIKQLSAEVKKARDAFVEEEKKVKPVERALLAKLALQTAAYQGIKAEVDSKGSYYDIAVDHRSEASPGAAYAAADRHVQQLKHEIDELRKKLSAAQDELDKTNAEMQREVTSKLEPKKRDLEAAEDNLKKQTVMFDRYCKAAASARWKLGDTIRALPILDGFASPIKIQQYTLNDLTIEYGSFRDVPRYDRCTTCHLSIERGSYDRATLKRLTKPDKTQTKLEQVYAVLEERQKSGEKLPFALGDLPSRQDYSWAAPATLALGLLAAVVLWSLCYIGLPSMWGTLAAVAGVLGAGLVAVVMPILVPPVRMAPSVPLTEGEITQYCAHPRLDLFVDSNSPHSAEKFGCTICHAGQGSATDFTLASHAPASEAQKKRWQSDYGWYANHDWDFPMASSRFVESSCLKCHHQVTDLIRQGTKEEAPKLLKGFNLVRENGCFGCHEIAGLKAGKAVGPDLRLEPAPALEWLSPIDQEKAKSDPANPPGTYRKVGPSLRRLAEKTNQEWTRKWLLDPRGFRPDTRMPHFYNLSTNSPDVLPEDQRKFPATEVHAIAYYLLLESKLALESKDTYRLGLVKELDDLQRQLLVGATALEVKLGNKPLETIKELDDLVQKVQQKQVSDPKVESRVTKVLNDLLGIAAVVGPLEDKAKKKLDDTTRALADLGLLSRPQNNGDINRLGSQLRQNQDRLQEALRYSRDSQTGANKAKLNPEDLVAFLKEDEQAANAIEMQASAVGLLQSARDVLQLAPEVREVVEPFKTACQPISLAVEMFRVDGSSVSPASIPAADKASEAAGRTLFIEKGCLACHSHEGTTKEQPKVDSQANFAPNLSRLVAKLKPELEKVDARRWLIQWLLNPAIYHPRTRMPYTQLEVAEAAQIADWLLAQKVDWKDSAWKDSDPEKPSRRDLINLARVYLVKAPTVTREALEGMLPPGDDVPPGVPPDRLKMMAPDADERVLTFTKDDKEVDNKLKWYIGRKSISRMGCFGCHDLTGFEQAKTIGTALNDWGKKDPERLAFEDADAFVKFHFNRVEERDDKKDKTKPAGKWEFEEKDGKTLPPYEEFFFEALEHRTREGFLHLKLAEPRSYDYNRLRTWDDRLRMPQFKFARSRQKADETEDAYAIRKEKEEAEAREAVMTFVLGLLGDAIPLKYLNKPNPDRLAEVKGRQVLDKFNCGGCHLIRPGTFEFKSSPEEIQRLDAAFAKFLKDDAGSTYSFPGHSSWTGTASPFPDRLVAHGRIIPAPEDSESDYYDILPTDALRFTSNRITHDLPAGTRFGINKKDMLAQYEPLGGTFTELMVRYTRRVYGTTIKDADNAFNILPPPLVHEGARVQPGWLYQFLLHPRLIRPHTLGTDEAQGKSGLRMPRFNLSPDDATALVGYFVGVDRLNNPGAGLMPLPDITQQDDSFWIRRNAAYVKTLGGDKKAEERLKELKDLLGTIAKDTRELRQKAAKDRGASEAEIKAMLEKFDRDFKDAEAQWAPRNVYAGDALRLILAHGKAPPMPGTPTPSTGICMTCHSIGPVGSKQAPALDFAFERLRPEWTERWIANPARMMSYGPAMPINFKKSEAGKSKELFDGTPLEQIMAVRDVLMNYPRLANLPADDKKPATAGGK